MTALPGSKNPRRPLLAPRGFTLVELLVVVGIIAMLAALVTPAVIRARSAARNAAIRTEIDLLHMAMMTYRNEYGSFPPCFSEPVAGGPSAKHLQRLFPRCTNVVSQLGSGNITPPIAPWVWLSGYTSDPVNPVTGTATGGPRRPLFDFDRTRLSRSPAGVITGTYAPVNLLDAPYIYIDNTGYATVSSTITSGTYFAVTSAPGVFFNPDTFQILCAGQNQIWGDEDDLSNFWRGTRAQFLSSGQ